MAGPESGLTERERRPGGQVDDQGCRGLVGYARQQPSRDVSLTGTEVQSGKLRAVDLRACDFGAMRHVEECCWSRQSA